MRKISFTLLFLSILFAGAGQKPMYVKSTYVAAKLIETGTLADIRATCGYYGYTDDERSEGDAISFSDSNGNSITLNRNEDGNINTHVIKLTTRERRSNVVEALKMCGYVQTKAPKRDIPSIKGERYAKGERVCIVSKGSPTAVWFLKEK